MKSKQIILIITLIIVSCSNQGSEIVMNTPMSETTSQKNTPISNESPTALLLTPTVIDSNMLVKKLLEDNASCQLPCWWGIKPGETTWDEARQILGEVSSYVGGQTENNGFYSAQVYLPYPYDFAKYMEHMYRVSNGIVSYIRVYNFDLAPNYFLSKFLENHGMPTEIWIRTFSKSDMDLQPFLIDLFYQDESILLEYGTGMPLEEDGGKIKNCHLNDMDSPFIHLWSLSESLSFQEAKKFLDTENLPEPKPLFDATGMDVKTFYETFKTPDATVCLETPNDLWP